MRLRQSILILRYGRGPKRTGTGPSARPRPGGLTSRNSLFGRQRGRKARVTALGSLAFGLGALRRRRGLTTPFGADSDAATAVGRPVRHVAEVLGHVRHRLGRTSELAAALLPAGLQITPSSRVQVAGR